MINSAPSSATLCFQIEVIVKRPERCRSIGLEGFVPGRNHLRTTLDLEKGKRFRPLIYENVPRIISIAMPRRDVRKFWEDPILMVM